jgi:hypothetical protein
VGVGQRVRTARAREVEAPERPAARNPGVEIFLWTRAAIWLAALFTLSTLDGSRNPKFWKWDDPLLTHDLGRVSDVWARWDSVWLLRIAEHGYGAHVHDAAFFPLYPATVGLVGRIFGGHYITAGIAVSLAAGLLAFVLLYRLAEPWVGADGARRTLLYLAVFPMSLFLGAVYTESLYLLLAVAAFLLTERGRFLEAGVVTGLALLSRPSAIALLPALAILAWRSGRLHAVARLAVAPAIALLFPLYLWRQEGTPWASLEAQRHWRHFSPAGPLGGVWQALRAAVEGVRQLWVGDAGHVYWPHTRDYTPVQTAVMNLTLLGCLVLFVVLTVVAWRRFGAPYGLFAALSIALPVSTPSSGWPLESLPRFGLVVFPFFLALAAIGGGRPRLNTAIVSVSSILLGISIVQWSLWQWVA